MHTRLKNEFTEDGKYHNLMRRLKWSTKILTMYVNNLDKKTLTVFVRCVSIKKIDLVTKVASLVQLIWSQKAKIDHDRIQYCSNLPS